jgi:hypothetical protein
MVEQRSTTLVNFFFFLPKPLIALRSAHCENTSVLRPARGPITRGEQFLAKDTRKYG